MNTDIAAQHALDHLAKDGPDALGEDERTVAAAWLFEAGVGNDGFTGYLSGHRGDLAFDAPRALRAIGALEMAAIAEEANAIFGSSGPPHDRAARRKFLQELTNMDKSFLWKLEQRYEKCSEDVDELLERFLARRE